MSRKKKRSPLPRLSPGFSLVDSHCHLDMSPLSENLEQVLTRAEEAAVSTIITIGIDEKSSRAVCQLAADHAGVYAAVGIHPHYAAQESADLCCRMENLCKQDKVVAYGEIGLDCYRNYAPLETQISCFRWQLALARHRNLPVIIHDREAHQLVHDILMDEGPFPAGGIIHCFSGNSAWAEKFLDLGFHLSIPGVVTFKKAEELHEATALIPLERLLVETDGPFLAPEPWRGKPNEPAYLLYTAAKIAQIKGISLEEVAQATSANIARLLNIETIP